MRRSVPRPTRPGRGAVILGLLVVAFLGIATTTGTGWPIVLVALLLGTIATSLVLPSLPLMRARLGIRTPTDAVAGLPLTIEITDAGPASVRACAPVLDRGWFRLGTGELVVAPARRGVVDEAVVQLRCASPLGLWPWRRTIVVTLERPLCVAPRPIPVELRLPPDALARGDELTRGARPYAAGDALRDIHWPATARAGALQVREREEHERARIELIVDLGAPGTTAVAIVEHRASWAFGAGIELLAAGRRVVVHTCEAGGAVEVEVRDRVALGRRLARAVQGTVHRPPASALVVDVAAEAGAPT